MATNPDIELPRRRDEEGDFHQLLAEACPHCGCTFYRAKDNPALVWDPGKAWDENCGDRSCHCHTEPVIGSVRAS